MDKYQDLRNKMVETQLVTRGIKSQTVLDAMRTVPRHLFVSENYQEYAYDDSPLSIGLGQTISQPYIVAYMTEQLEPIPGMKVLEIGTGSGYQAAILAHLGCNVFTIEKITKIYEACKLMLESNYPENINIKNSNGFLGWPEQAPFDAIIVTAAPDRIPEKLLEQLKENGKMILPIGRVHAVQYLKSIIKKNGKIIENELLPVRFVPMVE